MSNQQAAWDIRKEEILRQFSREELSLLEASTVRVRKARGEAVFLDEGESPKVYIVDEGYVRVCHLTGDGKRFIMGVLGPGEFFGAVTPDLSLESPEELLEVVREAKLLVIEAGVFHGILKNHPDMMLRLAQLLELKKRHFQKRLTSVLFKDITARTAELLLELFGKTGEDQLQITHQEIADMLGAARPVVSNVLSRMTKAGVLGKQGVALCLLNRAAMADLWENGAAALGVQS